MTLLGHSCNCVDKGKCNDSTILFHHLGFGVLKIMGLIKVESPSVFAVAKVEYQKQFGMIFTVRNETLM